MRSLIPTEGRIGRQGYVLGFVLPAAATCAATWVGLTGGAGEFSDKVMMGASLGWVLILYIGDALNLRRWHDLGKDGALYRLLRPLVVLLPVLAFAMQFLLPAQMASMGDTGALLYMIGQDLGGFRPAPIPMAILGLWAVGIIGNVAYLLAMPGDSGANAHGPGGDGANLFSSPQGGAVSHSRSDDPVERALAEYRAGLAQTKAASVAASPSRQAGSFGRKR